MVNTISPTLANPVAVLSASLEDKGVRSSFDQAAKDWKITRQEVRDLFVKADTDNSAALGRSTTPSELRDLHRIRDDGGFLLTKAAATQMDSKLKVLDNLPQVSISEDDPKLKVAQVAINRVSIQGQALGLIKPHSKSSSQVSIDVDGKTFQVLLNPGEGSMSVAKRLQAELKKSGYSSNIVTAKHMGAPSVLEVKPLQKAGEIGVGKYGEFSGTVINKHPVGIGGEAPPSGSYLTLDKPIKVEGNSVSEVFLGYEELKDGEKVKVSARLDVGTYGGVETAPHSYYTLTGVSNLTAGEPAFDGKQFKNAQGEVLESASYVRPLIMDAPAVLFVFDPTNGKAFRGSVGGFMPPKMNPFHGFNAAGKIAEPTAADKKALTFDADGTPKNKAGEELALIMEHHNAPGTADGMSSAWYLDPKAAKLYHVNNGGIAGFHNQISAVVSFKA